jgi:hypothetical protein
MSLIKSLPVQRSLSALLFLVLLLSFCPLRLYGSGDSLVQVISDRFTLLNQSYRQEKLYIHTDKSHYLPGETVWFKHGFNIQTPKAVML